MGFGKSPRWIEELRSKLVEGGAQTVIVTTAAGAEFVQIDGRDIDAHVTGQRRRRKLVAGVVASLLAVIAGGASVHAWQVSSLTSEIEKRDGELLAVNFALDVLADAVPRTVALPVVPDDDSREARVVAVKEFLQRKDAVFRSYVEATGEVMRNQVGEMKQALASAGLDMRHLRDLLGSYAAGGLPSEPETEDLYSYFVGDEVLASFDDLQRLGNFIAALPAEKPLPGGYQTSMFGMRKHPITGRADAHKGVDYVSRQGDRIVSAGDGTVSFAGRDGGYGNVVMVDHGNEIMTVYAHMSAINVRDGQHVQSGEVLGRVGSTGLSTGPHLHFEVRFKGRALDPTKVFKVARRAP